MLASGRFFNGTTSNSIKSQHDQNAPVTIKQVSRQKRRNDLDEAASGNFKNSTSNSNNNKESESINTSSASSSGYTSNNGAFNQVQKHLRASGLMQRGGSVQQLASYGGHNLQAQFHAHQQPATMMMKSNGNDYEASPRTSMVNKIGNSLRQISANGNPQHLHNHLHHSNHNNNNNNNNNIHPHYQQQQQLHKHGHQYHPQRSCSRAQVAQVAQVAQSSMVPMMIDDEEDDIDIDIGEVEVDVDGPDLIDDDDIGEGDDSGGLIAVPNGHDNNNNNSNNNNNNSSTISAFDPQTLYGFRETYGDRRRPLVDCVDTSAPALNQVSGAPKGEFQHNRYLQMLRQVQQQQQQQQQQNHSHPHHVMANTRRHLQQQQQQTDAAQSRLLVYNPIANYESAAGQQPLSLVYQHPNPTDQFQQQYHSFSYHQPVQQLQLASSNQHLQHPAYFQHLVGAGASQLDSALDDPSGSNNNSSSGSVVDSSVIIKQIISSKDKKQVKQAVAAAAAAAKRQNSKKNKDIMRMQQAGSKQHLSSPVDQSQSQSQLQQHHHHHHHRSKTTTTTGGATSRKDLPVSRSSNQLTVPKNAAKHLGCCGKMAKLLLFITNILFWSAGVALVAWGIYSLADDHKYNLSQLLIFEPSNKMSLFQLLSWSFITLGCASVLVGFCGCSAILKNNRWILGLYIFLILAIFALDLATGLLAIIFQEKLVANVRLRLINKLRSEYGVQASFTAAIDYIQTKFECCGLEGHFDYDQSLWRLQRLGGFEATVARTCCHLRNAFDDQAHINPRPMNESMCQSTDVRFHQSYRYRKGCLDDLERMVRQKIWTFTIGCGAVGAVILLSLLFATCFCRLIPGHGSRKSSTSSQQKQQQQQSSNHHHHHHDKTPKQTGGLTLAQQMDAQQQRHYR